MTKAQKWSTGLIIVIVGSLLCIRLIMPVVICHAINRELRANTAVTGTVGKVSLSIFFGEMRLDQVYLVSLSHAQPKVSLTIREIATEFDWLALFTGHVGMHIVIKQPNVSLKKTQIESASETEPEPTEMWNTLRGLMLPLPITDVKVEDGAVHYSDETIPKPFDLYANQINADLSDLQKKADDKNALPSHLKITAHTLGDGAASLNLDFNLKAESPTFALTSQLEHLQLSPLNPLLASHTDLRVATGEFNLYLKANGKNGAIAGFAKPFFKDLKMTLPPNEKSNPLKKAYRGAVNWLAKTFENKETKNAATQIDFQGKIDDPNTSLWSVISRFVNNAFWKALVPGLQSEQS